MSSGLSVLRLRDKKLLHRTELPMGALGCQPWGIGSSQIKGCHKGCINQMGTEMEKEKYVNVALILLAVYNITLSLLSSEGAAASPAGSKNQRKRARQENNATDVQKRPVSSK